MLCKVHVLIFEILQDAFYFFAQLLIKLTISPDYFLPHRWNPVVSFTCKHKSVVKLRLGNVPGHKNGNSDALPQKMFNFLKLLLE